jgi:hypothetical protein
VATGGLRAHGREDLALGQPQLVFDDGLVRLPVKTHRPSVVTCPPDIVVHWGGQHHMA